MKQEKSLAILEGEIQSVNKKFDDAYQEINKWIMGQKEMVEDLFVAFLSGGHVLLEGMPGLAKTFTVIVFSEVVHCDYKRIQFTPDVLPTDLIGTSVFNPQEGTFSIKKGPIFTNILLADEINRAPPKVQSALLEVMQENQATIQGETFSLSQPFFVLATQNPIEQEGTYPLPEAQTDRFMMKLHVEYPSMEQEKSIVRQAEDLKIKRKVASFVSRADIIRAHSIIRDIYVDEKILNYIVDIVNATRNPKKYRIPLENVLLHGASPRASIALKIGAKALAFLKGRSYVVPQDVKSLVHKILRHRICRSYEAEAEGMTTDDILDHVLEYVTMP